MRFILSGYEWLVGAGGSGSCGVKRKTPKVLMGLGSCHHIHDMVSAIRMAGRRRCCSARAGVGMGRWQAAVALRERPGRQGLR